MRRIVEQRLTRKSCLGWEALEELEARCCVNICEMNECDKCMGCFVFMVTKSGNYFCVGTKRELFL